MQKYPEIFVCGSLIVCSLILLQIVSAQRPPYAGLRPGGHSQINKYHQRPANASIDSRFGDSENDTSNTVAFGAPQRPPVGLAVVTPVTNYVPLETRTPEFTFDNRIGGTDGQSVTTTATAGSTASAPQPLPLDAHGDQLLVNQLSRLPEEKQPFWFINYQAIEAHRNGTGQNFAGSVASRGSFLG